ncbi:MAG: carbamoyltransferase HypF [Desulfovibrionaceae bacterium]|nr:carbamoyltransferase HypF [Desulfovibrionaceae bacterium]
MAASEQIRKRFVVTGRVQGVGFRPFVFRIAHERAVAGFVRNAPEGVIIEIQGPPEAVLGFGDDLVGKLPPLAELVSCASEDVEPVPADAAEDARFEIRQSTAGHGHQVLISPDTATCADCLADLFDPANRRYLYPFTNCTNCGPRYTITRSIPYDRPATSMACFPLCPECAREYADPLDRRFHAQPNACPVCGPRVWLAAPDGARLAPDPGPVGPPDREAPPTPDPLRLLAERLAAGAVAAIKGLGGFHLACDATSPEAVEALRDRKNRKDKPLAVMVPDLETARLLAETSEAEEKWLSGIHRPITLCRARPGSPLAPGISPDTAFVGLMLPYTPLHHVLLHHLRALCAPPGRPAALVMTSGNMSSEPICLGNREALDRLGRVADLFLLHDRDILIRTDDSVLRCPPGPDDPPDLPGGTGATDAAPPQFLRRARGFTPSPVFLAHPLPEVLAVGPELKNTLCFTKGNQAFVSQHIGDMENLETYGFHQEIAAHLEKVLQVEPRAVVRDLHPDYLSTRHAEDYARSRAVPLLALQHHYAHIHAVAAENRWDAPLIGLALDGTGYGEDQTIWGGECLYVDPRTLEHRRLARLAHLPLPGGESAIREPWRIAQGALFLLGETDPDAIGPDASGCAPGADWPWLAAHGPAARFLPQLLRKNVNCPPTSSCGRLFDAASALLGLKTEISYEGQAAIVLEAAQDLAETAAYPCPLTFPRPNDPAEGTPDAPAVLDTLELLRHLRADQKNGVPAPAIARRFHLGLARALADTAAHFAAQTGVATIGLSGGVLLNLTMHAELTRLLTERGLTVLAHTILPPGDACISLGQAAWGARALELGLA